MSTEQETKVVNALVDFVVRVAKGETINENETKVLPAVATVLLASKEL